MTLVLVKLGRALAMHAWKVQAVINKLPDENVMFGIADTGREWTRSEHHAFDRNFRVVESQTGSMQETTGVLSA